MTASLNNLLDTIERTWEDLLPPDRAEQRYLHVEGAEKSIGSSADRAFWFELPSAMEISSESGAELTEMSWSIGLSVRLIVDGYTRRDLVKRISNEIVLLTRSILKLTNYGTGVQQVLVDGAPSINKADNSIVVTFALRALTQETD